jgi:actin-like ATPase involved in cell morphogenesis
VVLRQGSYSSPPNPSKVRVEIMINDFVLGIDFGTSTTLVATPGEPPLVIPIGISYPWVASVISSSDGSNWTTGEESEVADVRDQIRSPKTSITFNNHGLLVTDRGVEISADEAIKIILLTVKEKCRENGLSTLGHVRMSCPAIWTGENRKRLSKLANEVGFNVDVDHIMDEPIAAAVSWLWNKSINEQGLLPHIKAMIFDLGGGTLDVALVDVNSTHLKPEITVMSARGTREAGDELDDLLCQYIELQLSSKFRFEVSEKSNSGELRAWIRREARAVKERLSVLTETIFDIEVLSNGIPKIKISREQLEFVFEPQLLKLLACTEDSLREAKMKLVNADINSIMREDIAVIGGEVDYIVLAGGMSQIPIIATELQKIMPNAKIEFAISKEKATSAIVEGVANQVEFANLNVHRPSFDFVMIWMSNDGKVHEELIFPAFTSLYDSYEIRIGKGDLGKREYFLPFTDPVGQCRLVVRSVGGKNVSLKIDGSEAEFISLNANRHTGISLKLYIDGRLHIVDSLGFEIKTRIREWPMVRWGTTGTKNPLLVLDNVLKDFQGLQTQHWDLNLD